MLFKKIYINLSILIFYCIGRHLVLLNKRSGWLCVAHIFYVYSLFCVAVITKISLDYHVSRVANGYLVAIRGVFLKQASLTYELVIKENIHSNSNSTGK